MKVRRLRTSEVDLLVVLAELGWEQVRISVVFLLVWKVR
jgi:hypothetical protein